MRRVGVLAITGTQLVVESAAAGRSPVSDNASAKPGLVGVNKVELPKVACEGDEPAAGLEQSVFRSRVPKPQSVPVDSPAAAGD